MSKEAAIRPVDDVYIPEEIRTPERNRKTTLEFLKDPTIKPVGHYGEYVVFSITISPFEGKFFVIDDNLIKYYVHYRNYRFVPLDSMCQVGVWRDEDFAPLQRGEGSTMAADVFQNILLKKFGELVSDKIQTKFGRYFWIRQIGWALTHNKYVYFLKLSGEEIGKVIEILRIDSVQKWKELMPKTWGKTIKDQRIRLLISEKPVFFPKQGRIQTLEESRRCELSYSTIGNVKLLSKRPLRKVVTVATTLNQAVRSPEVEHTLMTWIKRVNPDLSGVLIGGIAASLYMRPRYTEDVDLLYLDDSELLQNVPSGFKKVRPHALEEYKTQVVIELTTPKMFSNMRVDIAKKVIDTAHVIQGMKVASVEGVIALKLGAKRERDKADIVDLLKTNSPDFKGWPLTAEHLELLKDLQEKANAELSSETD